MKIICIADLQGYCKQIKKSMLPKGDMLLIAGDLAGWGTVEELEEVNDWLGTLSYQYKIVVAGNHDQDLEEIDGHKLFTNATYLQDELVEIEGIRIYGSPANEMNELRFNYPWGFCDPSYLQQVSRDIPENLDILLTHGGCYGILDQLKHNRKSVGSRDLLRAVLRTNPKYHVFGHIHESHGTLELGETTFVNAAICDEQNIILNGKKLMYQPIVIEIASKRIL